MEIGIKKTRNIGIGGLVCGDIITTVFKLRNHIALGDAALKVLKIALSSFFIIIIVKWEILMDVEDIILEVLIQTQNIGYGKIIVSTTKYSNYTMFSRILRWPKGPFIKDVIKFLRFLTPLLPSSSLLLNKLIKLDHLLANPPRLMTSFMNGPQELNF